MSEPSQNSLNDLSVNPNPNPIRHKVPSPDNSNQAAREEALSMIQQIKDQIKQREEEINKIKKISTTNEVEVFNRIDKLRWDKQSEAEKREINKNLLDEQVYMKNQLKRIEEVEREKERNERLKQIVQFRNEQELERQENLKKVSQYYKELSVQHEIRKQIQEIENKQYWESIPRPKENPPPGKIWNGSSRSNEASPTTGYHGNKAKMFYFTKKQPKNLVFNAITGELKDFSGYEQKSFSHLVGRNISPVQDRNLIKGAGNFIVARKMSPV